MESDQIITALKSLLSAAEREFDTKRCRHSSLKALFAARKVLRSVAALAEPDPESEPAPTDPERAIIGWVSDNCGLTVAQEAELARRLESLRAAVPTDAEVDAVISEFGIAALVVGARNSLENQGEALRTRDALRALIARRVAAATDLRKRLTEREDQVDDLQQSIDNITVACGSLGMQRCELPAHIADMRKERDEATKRADGLAADLAAAVVRADRAEKERDKARAETQQELSDLRAELDEVRDERDEARDERDEVRAEVERLRAAAKAAALPEAVTRSAIERALAIANKESRSGPEGQAEPSMTINAEVRRRMRQIKAVLTAAHAEAPKADPEPLPAHDDAADLRAENARLRLEIGLLESRVPSEPVTDAGSAVVEELLASLGLHPDTDLETVRSHIDSVRAEARCSADARQMGRDEERARAQALADAADAYVSLPAEHFQVRGTLFRDLCNALAAWKAGGAK